MPATKTTTSRADPRGLAYEELRSQIHSLLQQRDALAEVVRKVMCRDGVNKCPWCAGYNSAKSIHHESTCIAFAALALVDGKEG